LKKYRFSFTFGGLLIPESLTIAEVYRRVGDWAAVKEEVLGENLLKKTRSSSSYRYFREIRDRFQCAYEWEIEVISRDGDISRTETDVGLVLFAVFCRYYRLVGEFMRQVVRQRFSGGLLMLDAAMFRSFLLDQEEVHPEIAALSDSTREKLTTVAFRALREAGIVRQRKRTEPGELQRLRLSAELHERYCREGKREDYGHLLWSDEEITRCMTQE
jgi:hypothetical protein